MPTHTSRVTHATSVDSFSQTINQAVEVVPPTVTPLLPAQVLCFTRRHCCHLQDDEGKGPSEQQEASTSCWSWTVTDIFTLAEAPSQLLMSCWYLSLPIKQLFPLSDAQSVHVEERSHPAEAAFTSGLQQLHSDQHMKSSRLTTAQHLTPTNTTGRRQTEWHQPIRRRQLFSPFREDNFRKISSSDVHNDHKSSSVRPKLY